MADIRFSPAGYVRDESVCNSTEFLDLLFPMFEQQSTMQNSSQEAGQNKDAGPRRSSQVKEKEKPYPGCLATWGLLNNYSTDGCITPNEKHSIDLSCDKGLSTEEILRIAEERFIQYSTHKTDGISMFTHPHGSSLSDLSIDDARDVDLIHLLLAAAEDLACQQFDTVTKLINLCQSMASYSGTPVQRIASYFAEALEEKINRIHGRVTDQAKRRMKTLHLGTNNTFLASHQELPFSQAVQLAGIQAIIETAQSSRKVHVIDLQIMSGIQWAGLMQALADSPLPLQHLKITAVGTADQLYMEETGKRLRSFAVSLDLPFSFEVVYLRDMERFRGRLLNIEMDETVAVFSYMMLRSMLSTPDMLENVIREIKGLKPALMVVIEVEANHNSPTFEDRFIEALSFYCTFFDCLKDCMEESNECRTILEGSYFREGILDIVAGEGKERLTRNVRLDVWRAFFRRFGMVEVELSESSKWQASLVVKQFAQGGSCNVESNGKGLTLGWKGTPLVSLTAWRFS